MKRSFKIWLFILPAFAFIGCDRVTKDLAKEHLMNKAPISFFHNTFRLEYVENTGAAMSLGDELPKTASFWLLSILPLCFLLVLAGYSIKQSGKMHSLKLFSLAMIFAGGIGNIIDRLLYDRHVTDFMNLGISNIRTGIFNVADMCVTAGAIGLLLFYRDKDSQSLKKRSEI